MKIFRLFIMALAVIGLTACSSDDDNNAVELTTENLTGTYEVTFLQGVEVESDVSSSGNTSVVETTTITGDTFTNFNYTFSSSGSYTLSGSYRETVVVTANGQTQSDSEVEIVDESGTFTVNTASRTITFDGEITDVSLFDGTNLYITFNDTETLLNGNTLTEEFEIRMIKQN